MATRVKQPDGSLPAPIPHDEADRLTVLRHYNILDTLPEKSFDEITKLASYICGTPIALVSLVDKDRQWFKSRVGLAAEETHRDIAFCSYAILSPDDIMEVCDATKDERFNTNPLLGDDSIKLRYYCGAPLLTRSQQPLGTLCVIDTKPNQLTDTQKDMLRGLSTLVVDQLELRVRNSLLELNHSALEVSESELRSLNQILEERNADLEKRLKEVESSSDVLNTPAGGVINLLRQVQGVIGPKHDLASDLEKVISIIGSHKLYEVDVPHALQHGVPDIDSQTKGFLLTQLSNFSEKKKPNSTPKPPEKKLETNLTIIYANYANARRTSLEALGPSLSNLNNWDCDAFELQNMTGGSGLSCAGYHVISRHDLFTRLPVSTDKLASYLYNVEAGYMTNPYHNSTHATDVLLACNYLVRSGGLDKVLAPNELLALLVACVVHDLGHPGLNNAFLVNTTNKLAVLHNDRSVLENHHCVQAFKLLQKPENDFLESFTLSEYHLVSNNITIDFDINRRQEVRKLIIELVLATDMANHVEIMNQYQNRKKTSEGFDLTSKDDRLLAMKLLIKCADISNPARPQQIYSKWVDCVMEEFFQQGDQEKRLSLPVSAFMDRETTHIPKCQLGFIQYICLPTFTAYVDQFPGAALALTTLQANMAEWKRKEGIA